MSVFLEQNYYFMAGAVKKKLLFIAKTQIFIFFYQDCIIRHFTQVLKFADFKYKIVFEMANIQIETIPTFFLKKAAISGVYFIAKKM